MPKPGAYNWVNPFQRPRMSDSNRFRALKHQTQLFNFSGQRAGSTERDIDLFIPIARTISP